MKKIALFSIITIFSLNSIAQTKKKSPVDSRIYAITLTEEGKKKVEPIKDDMSFLPGGKFKSNYMFQAQFPQTDYDYEVDSTSGTAVIKFTIEAKNEDQGRFSWEGIVEGDNITGTAIIRKKGKIVHSYTFTGVHKNKKKAKPAAKVLIPAVPVSDSTKKAE